MSVNTAVDLSLTLGLGAAWITTELLSPTLNPKSCRWCDRNDDGSDHLNGFDSAARSALRWSNTSSADMLSSVFSFGLAPVAGFGVGALVAWHDDRLPELPADTLVVAESAVVAIALNQTVKLVVARERPDVHARSASDRAALQSSGDNLSFYSGHATLAFALATSAGTVASMRRHRLAPLMWVAGLTLATAGGYLRIAADRHYATDVLAGAVMGAAVGFSVPYFGHRAANAPKLALMPTADGAMLLVSGWW